MPLAMRGKLQGTPLKDKAGNVIGWRVRVDVTTPTGGKKKKGFERKTLKLAQEAALTFLAQNGRYEKAPAGGTVEEAVKAVSSDLWAGLAPNTRNNYEICARWLAAEFEGRPMETITAPQITAYMKRFAKGSPRMMNEHWKVARAVFGYAASDLGWIDSSPMHDARKPKATGSGMEWPVLTRPDFDKVLAAMEEPYVLFYRLLGETGARPSEAWGLDVRERLEFLRDVWWFVVRKGKTDASTRRVPIPDVVARDLEAAGPLPFAKIAAYRDPADHLHNVWGAALKSAEMPYTRPYEVRAMRINEWRRMAVPGLIRRTMVGHTSERTTNEWYDHVDAAEVLKALGVGSSVGQEAAGAEE